MENCKYLQCDPKNFICRICNKELSKKTFSNHLHEGVLDCQYCGKAFVNPRNLKTHIKKLHSKEQYVPPKSPDRSFVKELDIEDDEEETRLDEQTGLIISKPAVENPKKKYIKKTGRYECDLCGRIFNFAKSLTTHLLLHTKDYRFVCEVNFFMIKIAITKLFKENNVLFIIRYVVKSLQQKLALKSTHATENESVLRRILELRMFVIVNTVSCGLEAWKKIKIMYVSSNRLTILNYLHVDSA